MPIRPRHLVRAAALTVFIGWLPLLLYIPFDALRGGGGNPIGLGLLMVASTLIAMALLVLAAITYLIRRENQNAHPRRPGDA